MKEIYWKLGGYKFYKISEFNFSQKEGRYAHNNTSAIKISEYFAELPYLIPEYRMFYDSIPQIQYTWSGAKTKKCFDTFILVQTKGIGRILSEKEFLSDFALARNPAYICHPAYNKRVISDTGIKKEEQTDVITVVVQHNGKSETITIPVVLQTRNCTKTQN